MTKKLLEEMGINVKQHFKKNFKSPILYALLIITVGMYLVKYFLQYDFDTSMRRTIAYTDWGLAAGTFLFMMISVNEKAATTYGIYLLVAKVLSILFAILGSDLHKIVNSSTGGGAIAIGKTDIQHLFTSISNIMVVGTLIIEVLIIPTIMAVAIGNTASYFVVNSLDKASQKTAWTITFTFFEIALFFAMFQFVIYPFFNDMSSKVMNGELDGAGSLAQFLKPVMAFVFFPLLFMINNMRDSNLFLGRNQQLYIATQITFLIKYIALYHITNDNATNMGDIIVFPIIMLGFISAKLLAFLYLVFRTAKVNNKGWKQTDGEFFPIILAWKEHENKFFRHMEEVARKDKLKARKKAKEAKK